MCEVIGLFLYQATLNKQYSGCLYSPFKGLCTHVDHRVYKYTFGRVQDASSPTEFSSLFEHPLQLQLHQLKALVAF